MSLSSSISKQEDTNAFNDNIDFTTSTSSSNRSDSMTSSYNNNLSTSSSSSITDDNLDKFKILINGTLSDDDEDDDYFHNDLLQKDKSLCSSSELEVIRRERNRMHAKKTRLRKKRMLSEMETVSK